LEQEFTFLNCSGKTSTPKMGPALKTAAVLRLILTKLRLPYRKHPAKNNKPALSDFLTKCIFSNEKEYIFYPYCLLFSGAGAT
jgi:hypothetical protein